MFQFLKRVQNERENSDTKPLRMAKGKSQSTRSYKVLSKSRPYLLHKTTTSHEELSLQCGAVNYVKQGGVRAKVCQTRADRSLLTNNSFLDDGRQITIYNRRGIANKNHKYIFQKRIRTFSEK